MSFKGPEPWRLELLGADDMAWAKDGACKGLGGSEDLFFPERGESTKPAKAVCAGCPVQAECLDYAITTFQKFGVWGGASERERRTIRNQRRDAAA